MHIVEQETISKKSNYLQKLIGNQLNQEQGMKIKRILNSSMQKKSKEIKLAGISSDISDEEKVVLILTEEHNLLNAAIVKIEEVYYLRIGILSLDINNEIVNSILSSTLKEFEIANEWYENLKNFTKINIVSSNDTASNFKGSDSFVEIPFSSKKEQTCLKNKKDSLIASVIAAVGRVISSFSYSNYIFIAIKYNKLMYPICINYEFDTTLEDFLLLCKNNYQSVLEENKCLPEGAIRGYLGLTDEDFLYQIALDFSETNSDSLKYKVQFDKQIANPSANLIIKAVNVALQNILSSEAKYIKSISVLDESEIKLITNFNPQPEKLVDKTLYQIFEENATKILDEKMAVIYDDGFFIEKLTYKALLDKVNQIAFFLVQQRKYSRGSVVAVYCDPGSSVIVSLLAIWKIGCIYVPVDSTAPTKRIEELILDAKPSIIIIDNDIKYEKFLNEISYELNIVDINVLLKEKVRNEEINLEISLSDSAYILYTSGSTGKPKGVLIGQKQIANSLLDLIKRLPIINDDVLLALANCTFDLSILEWITPLIVQATCIITDRKSATNGEKIQELLGKYSVTVLEATPVTWQLLLKTGWQNDIFLKKLCGGDALTEDLVKQIAPVFHVYGTTETTTWSTCKHITLDDISVITIGKPIANTQLYILDQNGQLIPNGVVGELYIGGDGLGRYLDNNLNMKKFIKNPLDYLKEKRLYKTGDYALWSLDGSGEIIFIGRKDSQLKIRGHRIDICQIEEYIQKYHLIDKCVIVPNLDEENEICLVAFITVKSKEEFNEELFKQYCSIYLMPYMIPPVIKILDKLPITDNGKIDRSTLQKIKFNNQACLMENSNITIFIKNIFSKILYKSSQSIENNKSIFDEYGGNSINAYRLINLINRQFELALPIKTIYHASTVKDLEKIVREEILRKQENKNFYLKSPPIKNFKKDLKIPLSASQHALFFMMKVIARNIPIYNNSLILELNGKVDYEKLAYAIYLIVIKHETLRTMFLTDENFNQYQYIKNAETIDIADFCTFVNILENNDSRGKIMTYIRDYIDEPFELEKAPPFKVRIYNLANKCAIIVVCASHIIFDGTSEKLFCQELQNFYNNASFETLPVLLPEIQFSDYSIWQNKYCIWQGKMLKNSGFIDAEIKYWEKKLQGYTSLTLPIKKSLCDIVTYKGDHLFLELPKEIAIFYKKIASENKASVFTVLLTVFKILLFRYTSQEDISIGISVDGRYDEKLIHLIGHFVNILLIRNNIKPKDKFLDVLEKVNSNFQEAIDHQYVNYQDIVKILRKKNATPPDIIFSQIPEINIQLNDLKTEVYLNYSRYIKYPLVIYVQNKEDNIFITFEYSVEQYNKELIENLKGHYYCLLNSIKNNIDHEIANLRYITLEEELSLKTASMGEIIELDNENVIHIMDDVAIKNGNKIAIKYLDDEITYSQFLSRQSQLAELLNNRIVSLKSVKQERIVALYMPRSPLMEIARFAVLRAGAAFLSIDIIYPEDRVKLMLIDSEVSFLITLSACKNKISELINNSTIKCQIICLDEIIWKENYYFKPVSKCDLASLAYIMFTSGSTGRPKGVKITHKGLCNLIKDIKYRFNLTFDDKVLAISSYGFDASIFEPMLAFSYAAQLIIPSVDYQVLAGDNLVKIINKYQITFILLPPSIANTIMDKNISSLKIIQLGGEECSISLVNNLLKKKIKIGNLYGPTEGTVYITAGNLVDNGLLVIGKPTINNQILILDEKFQLVPVGVPGEIYFRGASLARGYINLEQTQQAFIKINDPFDPDEKIYVYKTGDQAAWTSSYDIIYHKRLDKQIKINAVRIELGEIENILKNCDDLVHDVTVIYKNKKIYAYIVPVSKIADHTEMYNLEIALEKKLDKNLPRYMLVSVNFIFLSSLPLTLHGKIDRDALAKIDYNRLIYKSLQPQSKVEKKIAEIWADVLKLEDINFIQINDSFFHLGGASLDSIIVIEKIREAYSLNNIDESYLFKNPRLKQFAAAIEMKIVSKFGRVNQSLSYFAADQMEIEANCIEDQGNRTQLSVKERIFSK